MTNREIEVVEAEHYAEVQDGIYNMPDTVKQSQMLTYTIVNKQNDIVAMWKRQSSAEDWSKVPELEITRMNIERSKKTFGSKSVSSLTEDDLSQMSEKELTKLLNMLKGAISDENDTERE